MRVQAVLDHVDGTEEVGPDRSILLMKHIRDAVLVGLPPDRLGLGLDTGHRVEHGDRPVEHPQARSTSTVKSTWPGVSMILIQVSFHLQVVAALVMVMPRSCSWIIQSMVAAPSWTSPIL